MSEFLAMGGYAPYIWSSYGLSLLVLGGLALLSWRRGRALSKALADIQADRPHRRDR